MRALTVAIAAVIILGVTGLPALATLPGSSQFELDGNAFKQTHDDWSNVLAGAGSAISYSFVTDTPATDTTYFTGGHSKDGEPISGWAYNALGAQDKDEITHAFSAAYTDSSQNPSHLDLYFGMDRFANSGDSTAGFWFFQNKVGLDGSGGFTGSHAVGDLLIVSDFSNGGAISSINAYKWNGSGLTAFTATGGDCSTHSTDALCAIVNQTEVPSPWPYTPKSGTANMFPAIGSFLEGGIDLNDPNVFGSNVPCFSTFLAETRASNSTTSTLSDFALGSVNTCGKVTGTKYNDLNGNGSRQTNTEPGLAGWTIKLVPTGNTTGTVKTTTTDADGNFEFIDVEPGTYAVCETLQSTWFQTEPTSTAADTACAGNGGGHGYLIIVGLGSTVSGNDFGNFQHPNLSITKTANPAGPVSTGDQIGFDIRVSNAGPGPANNVVVSDPLPGNPGLNWSLSPANTPTGCSITGALGSQSLDCSFATLASGSHIDIRVVSPTTKDSGCGAIENTATASADFNTAVHATDSVTINCPVLAITKIADAGKVSAGDTIGYTITVTNTANAGTAAGVKLSDSLPSGGGLSWSITSPPAVSLGWGGTCAINASVLTCGGASGVSLAAGDSLVVHVSSPTTAANCPGVTNRASATSTNDGNPVTEFIPITINCPSLSIAKTANPTGPVSAGDSIGFDITVTNNGAGTASNVVINDALPAGGDLNWSLVPPFSGCSITGPVGTQVLGCTFATLAGNGASIGPIHITSDTSASDCATVTNIAHVSADNNPDAQSSASVRVDCPSISISKTPDGGTAKGGDTIAFTITVSNAGPGTAHDVVITDVLPSGGGLNWTIDAGGTTAANCSISLGTLTCNQGDLASGASVHVRVTSPTTAAECGSKINNTGTVTLSNGTGGSNNGDITVSCPVLSINIEKAGPQVAHVGDTVHYTLTVTNGTPEPLQNVVVTDTKCDSPPVFQSGDTSNVGILDAGETWIYTCDHVVTSSDSDPLINVATVNATDKLGRPTSDQATHSVDILHPSISIVKTANPTSGGPGDPVTYTFVVKNTSTDTTLFNVTVVDDKLGLIGTIASLAPGQSVTLTKATTLPNAGGDLTNVGTATGTDVAGKKVSAHDNATVTVVLAVLVKTGTNDRGLGLVGFLFIAVGVAMATRKERGRVRPAFATSSSAAGRAVMLAANRRSWRMRRRRGPTTRARLRWRRSHGPPMRDGP